MQHPIKADDFSYTEISPEEAGEIRRNWKPQTGFLCNQNGCKEHPFSESGGPTRWACVGASHKPFTTTNPSEYFKSPKEIQAA